MEWQRFLDAPFEDKALEENSRVLNQEFSMQDDCDRLLNSLMNAIATALMEIDWAPFANVTPDFVVYATDAESVYFRRNFSKSVSPAMQKSLARMALL